MLFGYLARITRKIGFATGVLILPQRQTALVAKQAASLDVLCGGRLRLGIGISWNAVEYEALGENFKNRGRRSEEQIEVMRKLWSASEVEYEGEIHTIPTPGSCRSRPPQHPDLDRRDGADHRRTRRPDRGRLDADGPEEPPRRDHAHAGLCEKAAGRDPDRIGIECIIPPSATPAEARDRITQLADLGVSHVSYSLMNLGLGGASAHIDALKDVWDAVGDLAD